MFLPTYRSYPAIFNYQTGYPKFSQSNISKLCAILIGSRFMVQGSKVQGSKVPFWSRFYLSRQDAAPTFCENKRILHYINASGSGFQPRFHLLCFSKGRSTF